MSEHDTMYGDGYEPAESIIGRLEDQLATAQTRIAELEKAADRNKPFPLQSEWRRPDDERPAQRASCSWWLAEEAYGVYAAKYGKEQSLQRLADRAGFSNREMDAFVPGWRDKMDENEALRTQVAEQGAKLARIYELSDRPIPVFIEDDRKHAAELKAAIDEGRE